MHGDIMQGQDVLVIPRSYEAVPRKKGNLR